MHLLSTEEIRAWDAYTIENEPISSFNLMERAAQNFSNWFMKNYSDTNIPVYVCCGTGNNGGDGVAIARILSKKFYTVHVLICAVSESRSKEFIENLERVKLRDLASLAEYDGSNLPFIPRRSVIIDAILGIGFCRQLEPKWAKFFQHLNALGAPIVAVDIPSGLSADGFGDDSTLKAVQTITFQVPKISFFFPENQHFVGDWQVISIGLDPKFLQSIAVKSIYTERVDVQALLKHRDKHSHKGTFGTALLVTGSKGMLGAAILSTRAATRTGAGIVFTQVPEAGVNVIQSAVPEAIVLVDQGDDISEVRDLSKFAAIGVGCGIGTSAKTSAVLDHLVASGKPIVIDADALNILSTQKKLPQFAPNTIITPHPKEFDRLFGEHKTLADRIATARSWSSKLNIIIILKGAYTAVCSPDGLVHFNSTGNPGMATAGSGDVLTGMLSSLLARGYEPMNAAILGVYLHGMAGDFAKEVVGEESLVASDIIDHISTAFKKIYL